MKKSNYRQDESIVPLPVIDADGEYHDRLAAEGKVMVVSVYSPGKLSHRKWRAVAEYLEASESAGFTPLLLLAASPRLVCKSWTALTGPGMWIPDSSGRCFIIPITRP